MVTGADTPVGTRGWGLGDTCGPNNDAAPVTNITTVVGESGMSTMKNGLDFDSTDTLYMVNCGGVSNTINTATGVATPFGDIGTRAHHGDFDLADIWYGIDEIGGSMPSPRNLVVADLTADSYTMIPTVDNLHTLTFVEEEEYVHDGGSGCCFISAIR